MGCCIVFCRCESILDCVYIFFYSVCEVVLNDNCYIFWSICDCILSCYYMVLYNLMEWFSK